MVSAVRTGFGVWYITAVERHHGDGACPTPAGLTMGCHVPLTLLEQLSASDHYEAGEIYLAGHGLHSLIIYALN